ncbi:permease, DMT superfamily [Legionella busanensis]|uniref:Permease, DMT superfamily n=1 Tax=Legionella busanensis TaxID=190655 RepID=A0A378KAX9_9GAMM|nr:DMT family transporter [Legionella busanensis]STX81333.1 permease, DMT superfamily [Legionella busanensis]
MKDNKVFWGTSAILLATMLWGMTFSFIKDAVATLNPFNFLYWRFGIASVLLYILFFKKIKFNKKNIYYGVILGIFLAGTVVFQTIGLCYTTASTASFITGLSVVFVALFESFLNKCYPSLYLIVSVAFSIIGIGFITLSNGLTINQGDVWVLLCAFCFASYIIIAGKASRMHEPLTLTFLQSIFVCIVVGIASFLTDEIRLPQQINVWFAILFCSIFASIIAFILQLKFQRYVSSSKAAIIFSLEPVFATITAALYLKEKITTPFFIGALMIIMAILLSEYHTKKRIIPQN